MRLFRAFAAMYLKQAVRTLGLPASGFYSGIRFFTSVFLFLSWIILIILSSVLLPPACKHAALISALNNWVSVFMGAVALGILTGANWLKFGELNETGFLKGLPLSMRFVSILKTLRLFIDLALIAVIIVPVFIPWGPDTGWKSCLAKAGFMILLAMSGIFSGVSLSSICVNAFFAGKAAPYLVSVVFILVSIWLPLRVNLPHLIPRVKDTHWLFLNLPALIILSISILAASAAVPALFDAAGTGSAKRKSIDGKKSGRQWGGTFTATARKDLLHYLREKNQLLQMMFIFALLAIMLSRANWSGQTGIRLALFFIPFSFSGIIALHLIGSDGAILPVIKMLNGTLRQYYLTRFALSSCFTAVPAIAAYSVLSLVFYRYGFRTANLAAFLLLVPVSASFSLGTSVIFRQNNRSILMYKKGVSVAGEILYWIIGAGLPLELSLWKPGTDVVEEIPAMFNIYAAIAILAMMAVSLAGYFYIDKTEFVFQ